MHYSAILLVFSLVFLSALPTKSLNEDDSISSNQRASIRPPIVIQPINWRLNVIQMAPRDLPPAVDDLMAYHLKKRWENNP
ncbi:unnamed protein product, partial [Mesorhabditis belari]|uniref:Uncharacterized protein n=1 Tax=Mesorhabditis belari TaxID=2138241 RepID=A0AAF3ECU0_9BILA